MRRACQVAFPVLLVACAPVRPEPQTPEPVEAASPVAVAPALETTPVIAAPELEPPVPVDPSTQPRLEVVARKLDREQREMGYCRFEVQHHAFPAVSVDGATLVAAQSIDVWPTDVYVELRWLGADSTRVETIYNHDKDVADADGDTNCDAAIERARERVTAFNTELAAQTWRPLQPFDDVLYSNLRGYDAELAYVPDGYEPVGIDEVLATMPLADRPVEVYYHAGHVIARVRDAKVLQKTPRPEWLRSEHNNEFCGNALLITAIEFDRASGLALVHYNFNSGDGCLCSDPGTMGRIELSPELLAEAELRSMEKFLAASKLAAEQAFQ